MRILQFDHIPSSYPYGSSSYSDGTLDVEEPWDAEQMFLGHAEDIAGMAYDTVSDTLLVVSQMSSTLLRVDPDTGQVLESMNLTGSLFYEGVTLFEDCKLAVVAEPRDIRFFEVESE